MSESVGFIVFKPHMDRSTGILSLWLDTPIDKTNISQAVRELIAAEKNLVEEDK
jgi:hypothetical protein